MKPREIRTDELTLRGWFTPARRKLINASAVEHQAQVADKTLVHFLKGRRGLSVASSKKITQVLTHLGYKN